MSKKKVATTKNLSPFELIAAQEWAKELKKRLGKEGEQLLELVAKSCTLGYKIKTLNRMLVILQDQPPELPPGKLKDCIQIVLQQIQELGQQREAVENEERQLKQKLTNTPEYLLAGMLLQLVNQDLGEK